MSDQRANPDNQHDVPGQEGQQLQEPDPARVEGGTENPASTVEVDTAQGDHMRFTQGEGQGEGSGKQ